MIGLSWPTVTVVFFLPRLLVAWAINIAALWVADALWDGVRINGAGRTDTGVHALGQVIGFQVDTRIPIDRVVADAWKGQAPVDSVEMAVSRVGKYEGMTSFKPGQLFPGEFNPAKSRILAMLALTKTKDPTKVQEMFDAY